LYLTTTCVPQRSNNNNKKETNAHGIAENTLSGWALVYLQAALQQPGGWNSAAALSRGSDGERDWGTGARAGLTSPQGDPSPVSGYAGEGVSGAGVQPQARRPPASPGRATCVLALFLEIYSLR